MLSERAENFLKENNGKSIVFTNGCFDIIHAGHVSYLNEARQLGEILFVGLNSDVSVRKIKGNSRPIVNECDRRFVLENLKSVDFVEIFDEETPYKLVKCVRPNVLVKGGDWKVENIVGHDIVESYGGSVLSLNFKQGHSTTNIIKKISER